MSSGQCRQNSWTRSCEMFFHMAICSPQLLQTWWLPLFNHPNLILSPKMLHWEAKCLTSFAYSFALERRCQTSQFHKFLRASSVSLLVTFMGITLHPRVKPMADPVEYAPSHQTCCAQPHVCLFVFFSWIELFSWIGLWLTFYSFSPFSFCWLLCKASLNSSVILNATLSVFTDLFSPLY